MLEWKEETKKIIIWKCSFGKKRHKRLSSSNKVLIVWYQSLVPWNFKGNENHCKLEQSGRLPERFLTCRIVKLSTGKLSSKTGRFVKEEPTGQERQQEQKIYPRG